MSVFSLSQKINLAKNVIVKRPIYVQFYITSRCNLACEQCSIIHADAKHQEMNIEQINKVAENLKKIGVTIILLIGGEPFVRKDISQIVEAFTSRNMHVRMQTNGVATSQQLKDCVKAGGKDISISLDTLDPSVQDKINGGFNNSWERAINTISKVTEIFPEKSTAFFNSVIMPRNLKHIKNVIKFATKIGWGVSLVPVHFTEPTHPLPYRTIDYDGLMNFTDVTENEIYEFILEMKKMKKNYNLYDSDEYLDDVARFILKKPTKWRSKNSNTCDSPSLYFAIAPSGLIKVCCDFEINQRYYIYDDDFPEKYNQKIIHNDIYKITKGCEGCMYGSYPEITITARYLSAFIERLKYFNVNTPKLKKFSTDELRQIATDIINESH